MQFTSPYKTLVVKFGQDQRVRFEDGKAEVEGDLARKLADFAKRDESYGIEVVGDVEPEPVDPYKGKQAKTLRKEAEGRGLTVPEDAERDDIVALLVADDEKPAEGDDTDE